MICKLTTTTNIIINVIFEAWSKLAIIDGHGHSPTELPQQLQFNHEDLPVHLLLLFSHELFSLLEARKPSLISGRHKS